MEAKADNEDSNLNNEDLEVDKIEESDSTIKHRKIMDCAKETFESGKTNTKPILCCYNLKIGAV